MYKLLLHTTVFTLIYLIIFIGFESIPLKIVLGIIGLTFLPKVRKKLYKPQLVIRKSKVALYTSIVLPIVLVITDLVSLIKEPNFFSNIFIVIPIFIFSLLGTYIYGLPVSLFSDLITAKIKKYRIHLAFLVHFGFGLLTFFFLGPFMSTAALCAIIFFLIDEFLRKKEYYPSKVI